MNILECIDERLLCCKRIRYWDDEISDYEKTLKALRVAVEQLDWSHKNNENFMARDTLAEIESILKGDS